MLFSDKDGIRPVKLGRWFNIDPMAEKYGSYSPYVYCLNNPQNFIDPDGMISYTYYGEEAQAFFLHLQLLEMNGNVMDIFKRNYLANSSDLGGSGDKSSTRTFNPSGPKGADGPDEANEEDRPGWIDKATWAYFMQQPGAQYTSHARYMEEGLKLTNQKSGYVISMIGLLSSLGERSKVNLIKAFSSPFGLWFSSVTMTINLDLTAEHNQRASIFANYIKINMNTPGSGVFSIGYGSLYNYTVSYYDARTRAFLGDVIYLNR